jgi:5'-hydroxyaverantin dehydrogenase
MIGRAFAIMPEGFFDIGDDIEGGYGGDALRKLMAMRREAGDFLHG